MFSFFKSKPEIERRMIRNKTFFPAHWPREKVISAIYEAFENFKHNNAQPKKQCDGKYKVIGQTQEGIEIEMIITQDGTVRMAYPLL